MGSRKDNGGVGDVYETHKGKYRYWAFKYLDPYTGKEQNPTFKTREQAVEKRLAIIADLQKKQYIQPDKITVGEWCDQWLDDFSNVQPATQERRASIIKNQIKPMLGGIKLQELNRQQCQRFLNRIQKEHPFNTAKLMMSVFKQIIKSAQDNDYIIKDPTHGLCPKTQLCKASPEYRAMSEDEERRYFQALSGNECEYILKFQLYSGCRISEVLGLSWTNVNLTTGEVVISDQLTSTMKIKNSTKTGKSRKIYVSAECIEMLRMVKSQQNEAHIANADLWRNEYNLVFTNKYGIPINYKHVLYYDKIARKLAGLPTKGATHINRKTFASDVARSGNANNTADLANVLGNSKAVATQYYLFSSEQAVESIGKSRVLSAEK